MQAHAEGRRVVLIVDEAQTLSPELLEQVRLLTNLETSKQKLLQIILIGQPELRELLDRPEMRQIAQRITGRYHLEPLQQGRHARVREPSAARRRRAERHLHEARDRRAVQALARHSAAHQRHRRPRVARGVHEGPAQRRREARLGGGGRGVRQSAAGRRGGRSRRRRPASRPSCSASRTWARRRARPRLRPSSFSPRRRRLATARRRADRTSAAATAAAARAERDVAGEPPPAPTTLEALLADPQFALATDDAIAELLALWGAPYDAARGEPCAQAQEQGLRCLFQRRGTLGELRRVNWPTILSLVTAGRHRASRRRHGARLRPRAARRERQDVRAAARRAQLLLVRRSPPAVAARRCAGARSRARRRRRRRALAARRRSRKLAASPPRSSARTIYDDALEQRVRAYQRVASTDRRRHRRRTHADRDVGRARRSPTRRCSSKDH